MSGLGKWNRRESDLCRLKNFLLRERPRESLNSSAGSDESAILDLDQSFQKILDTHFKKRKEILEDKENLYKTACENTLYASISQTTASIKSPHSHETTVYNMNDTTFIVDALDESDDICFEDLERMCNKTLSDPDNTIHQYLDAYRRSKSSSTASNFENESACIDRLLKEIDKQLKEVRSESLQLNDVEEPSGLWETTIADLSSVQLPSNKRSSKSLPETPVIAEKMANAEHNVENDLQGIATRLDQPFSSTIQTEHKKDAFAMKSSESDDKNEMQALDSEYFRTPEKVKTKLEFSMLENSFKETEVYNVTRRFSVTSALGETFYVTPRRHSMTQKLDMECDLIDLDATACNVRFNQDSKFSTSKSNFNIVCDPAEFESTLDAVEVPKLDDIDGEANTIILLSDDEDGKNDDNENEPHNTAFSIDLENLTLDDSHENVSCMENLENQREFNNTLEEVDYIMKRGMKYLAANGQLPNCLQTKSLMTPSPMSSPQTPNTVIKMPKKIVPEEKTKLQEHFKKPQVFTKIPQCKSLAALKKPVVFEHIVSPVGAYIKNTAKTPITTNFKPTQNIFHSKSVRGLDYCTKDDSKSVKKGEQPAKEFVPSLPRKAYIASELKHVVDQRKPVNIPGGEKIHKYLKPSKVASVIRHEGKIKLNTPSCSSEKPVRRADNSLANLSTISGDISLHILRDAKI